MLTLLTDDVPQAEPGAKAYRAVPGARSAQSAELVAVESTATADTAEAGAGSGRTTRVVLRLTGGMGSGRTPKEGSVPDPGDRVVFTFFEHDPRGGPGLPEPEDTPWTHGGPPDAAAPPERPDPVTAEDYL
jgi:hypothetical protein